jgi:TetR/AcrR family transcriptional repressor of nem operon
MTDLKMGRKSTFDHGLALERAMRLFWAKGYGGTSVRDLLKVMKIGESSFYYLFGSKRRLYLESLKRYNETVTRRRWEIIQTEPSVRKGIREFFKFVMQQLDDPKNPRLCLMSGSLAPDVLNEKPLESYVKTEMAFFEESFRKRLEEAKNAGELPPDFKADMAAQILFTYLQGYWRVVNVLKPREKLRWEIESLLTSLGL